MVLNTVCAKCNHSIEDHDNGRGPCISEENLGCTCGRFRKGSDRFV